jgi:hypothetical protein
MQREKIQCPGISRETFEEARTTMRRELRCSSYVLETPEFRRQKGSLRKTCYGQGTGILRGRLGEELC